MKNPNDESISRRWKLLPHSKTHRVLVVVVLLVAVAIMLRMAW